MRPTQRGLFEGPEWSELRSHIAGAARFDDEFRFIAESISRDPYENSSEFWDERHRVMVTIDYPNAPETWIYYRIEEDDNNVELLWIIQPRVWLPVLH